MTGYAKLSEIFSNDVIKHREDRPGDLFEVEHDRGSFGDETLLIRFLRAESEYRELLKSDISELEAQFYDEDTPNQWNIQLFWAYDYGNSPPDNVRQKLENDTRFAIRRCVPTETLEDFIAPLQTSKEKLDNISTHFNRSTLIGNIIEHDLEFLFENSSREEKLDKIKSNSTASRENVSPDIASGEPLRKFVDTTRLGEFRQNAHVDKLDAEPFTLLYGRNGTGKTSLLDGTTFGLVGQIRREDARANDYDGLGVTLEDNSEPLSTDSTIVNNRVADWFGFRPHGPAKKHVEFYRVNYLEAGSATRLVDPDPDLDIERTLRRFLFGEELTDARKDKEWLLNELEKEISDNEEKIRELEFEVQELHDKQERANAIFSKLDVASQNLSPATTAILHDKLSSSNRGTEPLPESDQLEQWATWAQRFSLLRESIDALPKTDETLATAGELQRRLTEAAEQMEEVIHDIASVKELQTKRTHLDKLEEYYASASTNQLPASVALVALILRSNGIDSEDLTVLAQTIDHAIGPKSEPVKTNSIGEWRDSMAQELSQQLETLEEQKETIEEISQLEERRRQLQQEIRKQTEEYLSITDDVHYCPACYVEQNREEILTREKPKRLHSDKTEGVPTSLLNRISKVKRAIDLMDPSTWKDIDYEISVRFNDLCGMDTFRRLWDRYLWSSETEIMFPGASDGDVETFAFALREYCPSTADNLLPAEAIESAIRGFNTEMDSLTANIPEFEAETTDMQQLEERYQDRKDALETGLQILEEHWPDDVQHQQLNVQGDHRIVQNTLDEVNDDPSVLEMSTNLQAEIEKAKDRINELRKESHQYRDSIGRLKSAFEGAGGEEELNELVGEHMTVISTLFKAFQRPYEFESVQLKGDSVVVQRRDSEGSVPIASMSSGQRAALALAIFVTNNLAHNTAPPLMMLDEPFAHLDDVNTVSFFNLLIDLATREERQIIFATASEDIADLLQRKIGKSPQFTRVNLPSTKPTID